MNFESEDFFLYYGMLKMEGCDQNNNIIMQGIKIDPCLEVRSAYDIGSSSTKLVVLKLIFVIHL